jgi:hypothetical protein
MDTTGACRACYLQMNKEDFTIHCVFLIDVILDLQTIVLQLFLSYS